MLRTKLAATVLIVSSLATAGERTTIMSNQKRYYVSQDEASKILKDVKEWASKDPQKQRPPVSKIATFNGGTAAQEEDEMQQRAPCWADENQFFQEIQLGLLNPWMKSWISKNPKAFDKLLAKGSKLDKFAVNFTDKPKKVDNIDFYSDWKNIDSKNSVPDYLSQYKTIEDFDLVTFKYTARRDYRDKNLNMVKADLHIQYDLRGITNKGERRNDRGPIKVTVAKVNNEWKIENVENWGLETLASVKPGFEDVTNASGVTAIPEYQRLEAIRRGGYAIAVGDVNGDGYQDLFLGAYGPAKLLLGSANGTFTEAKGAGLAEETLVKSAAFADFNNDGLPDLLITRFVPTTEMRHDAFRDDVIIYQNLGQGKFDKIKTIVIDRSPADNAMPAAVADFNGDGLLDFYIGFPGTKDFTTFGKLPDRKGIRAQGIYMNLGNFKFSENNVGDYNSKVFDKVTEHHRIYPHSSVALDFDQDGDMDIMVIDDQGNISPAYQNNGKGQFVQAQQYIGVTTAGSGMGMAAADIDNNGVLDMVFSNVNFTSKIRTDASCKSNWNDDVFQTKDHGLKFYYGLRKGQFADATLKNGLFYAGEGLAGVEFIDYNNDGYQDLYVANGLWSGTNKEQDLSHIFTRSHLATNERTFMSFRVDETHSHIMKILSGFMGDIFTGKKGKDRPQIAGHQRNRLFRNMGDGTFMEVGYLENVDSIADGYVIAKADIDNDGDLDIILRNGDPGSKEVNFPAVQVFKNNFSGNSVRFKLVADSANKDAVGASVTLTTKSVTQLQQLINNNGTAQSEKIVHFGIGAEKKAEKVVITWPNGKTTTLTNVPTGLHVVHEKNKGLTLN